MTLTAEVRLGGLTRALIHWCNRQTYSAPEFVYGWSRADLANPDRYRFTVTMGYTPIAEYEVTEDQLEETSVQDLTAALELELLPHTLSERDDEK